MEITIILINKKVINRKYGVDGILIITKYDDIGKSHDPYVPNIYYLEKSFMFVSLLSSFSYCSFIFL